MVSKAMRRKPLPAESNRMSEQQQKHRQSSKRTRRKANTRDTPDSAFSVEDMRIGSSPEQRRGSKVSTSLVSPSRSTATSMSLPQQNLADETYNEDMIVLGTENCAPFCTQSVEPTLFSSFGEIDFSGFQWPTGSTPRPVEDDNVDLVQLHDDLDVFAGNIIDDDDNDAILSFPLPDLQLSQLSEPFDQYLYRHCKSTYPDSSCYRSFDSFCRSHRGTIDSLVSCCTRP